MDNQVQDKINKNICVVIDTNIWFSDKMLMSNSGCTLKYHLSRIIGAKIGLPEVIEYEIEKNIVKYGAEKIEEIRENMRYIQMITGSIPELSLPTEDDFKKSVDEQFSVLEQKQLLYRIPFTISHAKNALRRVVDETPPNGKENQQYKDSAIWEAILCISEENDVHFITSDKAFYKSRSYKEGLHKSLKDNLKEGKNVIIHENIDSCLPELKKLLPPIDYPIMRDKINKEIDSKIRGDLNIVKANKDIEFILSTLENHVFETFVTENSEILFISFNFTYKVTPVDETLSISNATLLTIGDCFYNHKTAEISYVQVHRYEYKWYDSNGEQTIFPSNYFGINVTMGQRTLPYEVRTELDKYPKTD
ncbi:MAG: DUF4935 domain-containing protein [Nitrospirae bacterium]|nr:DUF4935 domain-containing protein [Nitrospirota bacterium]